MPQHDRGDFAWVYDDLLVIALGNQLHMNEPVLHIQAEHIKLFVGLAEKMADKIAGGIQRSSETDVFCGRRIICLLYTSMDGLSSLSGLF